MTHAPCDHVPGCAGPGRCGCICDPCIEREDAENERRRAEQLEVAENEMRDMKIDDLRDWRRFMAKG
jgi:hypothetical protein